MVRAELQSCLYQVLHEVGLLRFPRYYRDIRFILAIITGVLTVFLIHDWIPVFSSSQAFQWPMLVAILIWQPFIEELLFRGFIQGQLSIFEWGRLAVCKITVANILTSILFVGLHLLYGPQFWSLTIFIPSLLFGYFRDVFDSVYPSIFLHSTYNFIIVFGLLAHGNLVMETLNY